MSTGEDAVCFVCVGLNCPGHFRNFNPPFRDHNRDDWNHIPPLPERKPLDFTAAELERMQLRASVGLALGRTFRDFESFLGYLTAPRWPTWDDVTLEHAVEAHARMMRDWLAGGES